MRNPDWPVSLHVPELGAEGLSLEDRTRILLREFDAEEKGYAFDDGGDGTAYATWFADLLDEWLTRLGLKA